MAIIPRTLFKKSSYHGSLNSTGFLFDTFKVSAMLSQINSQVFIRNFTLYDYKGRYCDELYLIVLYTYMLYIIIGIEITKTNIKHVS